MVRQPVPKNGNVFTKRLSGIEPNNAGQTCTSVVTDMSGLFSDENGFLIYSFNADISSWDVSSVTDMSDLFLDARSFNSDIGNWDVSNVTDMSNLFSGAHSFNQYIGDWDVSNVADMLGMFYWATSFNQDLSGWCVSGITSIPQSFDEELLLGLYPSLYGVLVHKLK